MSFWVNVNKHILQNECRHGKLLGSRNKSKQILQVVKLKSTSDERSMFSIFLVEEALLKEASPPPVAPAEAADGAGLMFLGYAGLLDLS